MLRKITAMILAVVMTVLCGSVVVSANGIMPRYVYTDNCESTLVISGTTATCTSKATGYSGTTTKIKFEQTLQKVSSGTSWINVASWSETDTGYRGVATNTKSNLSGGTYRLKTVFYVYAGSDYEQITLYSQTKFVSG